MTCFKFLFGEVRLRCVVNAAVLICQPKSAVLINRALSVFDVTVLMEVGLQLSSMKYEDEASVVNIDPSKLSPDDLLKGTQSCLSHFILFYEHATRCEIRWVWF